MPLTFAKPGKAKNTAIEEEDEEEEQQAPKKTKGAKKTVAKKTAKRTPDDDDYDVDGSDTEEMAVDKKTGEITTKKSAKGSVTKKHSDGSEETDEHVIGHAVSAQPLATVSIHASRTVNLGNFESMRIQVGVSIPCQLDDVDQAYEQGSNWVEEKMKAALPSQDEEEE